MTGILVAPDLGTVLVERVGIFTVPIEAASVSCSCPERKPCQGLLVTHLSQEFSQFAVWAKQMGEQFIARQKPRGFEWAEGQLWLHGPYPSLELNQRLADAASSAFRDAVKPDKNGDTHPELALPFVFERDAFSPYVDYRFIGRFLFKDRMTDLEV